MTEQKQRRYPHYHPTEGYGYKFDMTPSTDWWAVTHVVLPEGRFFNDDELWELYVVSKRLTPENIELMKKWDRDNNFKDRFTPHHNGLSDERNLSLANSSNGSKEDKKFIFEFLTGKHSRIDLDFFYFKRNLLKSHMEHT